MSSKPINKDHAEAYLRTQGYLVLEYASLKNQLLASISPSNIIFMIIILLLAIRILSIIYGMWRSGVVRVKKD